MAGDFGTKNVDRSSNHRLFDESPILYSPSTDTGADGDPRFKTTPRSTISDNMRIPFLANGLPGNVIPDLLSPLQSLSDHFLLLRVLCHTASKRDKELVPEMSYTHFKRAITALIASRVAKACHEGLERSHALINSESFRKTTIAAQIYRRCTSLSECYPSELSEPPAWGAIPCYLDLRLQHHKYRTV